MVKFKEKEMVTPSTPVCCKGITKRKMYEVLEVIPNPMIDAPENYLVMIIDDYGVNNSYHYTHFRKTKKIERLLYGKNQTLYVLQKR